MAASLAPTAGVARPRATRRRRTRENPAIDADVTIDNRGEGRALLLLHGGVGPWSVIPFAERLAAAGGIRTITPTHPGFSGTARPERLRTPADLADHYLTLLAELDMSGVTVVGFSFGGWIAAELALRADPRVARLVIVDGVGIEVEDHPIAGGGKLTPAELHAASYHDPDRFAVLSDEQRDERAANLAALASYAAGGPDGELPSRLAEVRIPALVVWGESDRIVDPGYGRAYAEAFADARFELIPRAGHLPQLEQPEALARAILAFVGSPARPPG